MSSQDRLENVLRDIHVMISKSETYDTDRIIVSKQDIFNLIDRLNASIYEIMDEYELTQQSRDRALREHKKEGDKIIWDASRQAEDIYAASVLYTEEALNHLNVMVEEADTTIGRLYKDFQNNMKQQQETIRENHLELKSQLQLLADTEKYLKLIEERNREIERERAGKKGRKTREKFGEKHTVIKPEIKINEEYFRKAGIPIEKDDGEKKKEDQIDYMEPLPDEGVIEATLKKTEEDIRRTVLEEKATESEHSAASLDTLETAAAEEKESAVDTDTDSRQQAADLEYKGPADSKDYSEDIGLNAASGMHEADRQAPDTDSKGDFNDQGGLLDNTAEGAERMNATEGSADQAAGPLDGNIAGSARIGSEIMLDESLKESLDAEYFKWKNNEKGEETSQPRREKVSLLDKLMGKKKSF